MTATKHRGVLLAAAPVLLLLLFAVGGRLLQSPPEDAPVSPPIRPLPPVPVRPVDDATQKQLMATVIGQLNALRTGNYKTALTFATTDFQTNVTADDFQRILSRDFAFLALSTKQTFRRGQTSGTGVTLLTILKDKKGKQEGFVYLLRKEGETWRVEGCSPALSPEFLEEPGGRQRRMMAPMQETKPLPTEHRERTNR